MEREPFPGRAMGAAADLRGRMRESWGRFRDRVEHADLERLTASGWTVKEMLAHVAFWLETIPPFVTGMWRGDPSAFDITFPSGYRPEDPWPRASVHNAREAAWARERSGADVRQRLDAAAAEIVAFLETVTDEEASAHADYFAELPDHLDEHRTELEQ